LRFEYGRDGKRSLSRTLGENLRHVGDVLFAGEACREVERVVRDARPHVAICDAEPWTHAAASRAGVPRISFDHYGILAYCRPPIPVSDRLRSVRDVFAYRTLCPRPDRIIVSSFYDGGAHDPHVRFVGPLLRAEVLRARAAYGDHLLVYLNQGEHQLTPRLLRTLQALDLPVLVYGTHRRGDDGRLSFRPASNEPFVADLASCRAVFSTAGNQLVGEAMWFGKPMLVMPEHSVEQRLNAAAVERLGIGMQVRHDMIDPETFARFLAGEHAFREAARRSVRDGRVESIAALESFAGELARGHAVVSSRAWRYA
jgi:uncharacterized protein (TIGR00661 family)